MSKRIAMSASERAELVLRLLRREATAGQLAREVGISEPTLYQWRESFLKGGIAQLDRRPGRDLEQRRFEQEIAKRDQLIGEMTVAMRVLKKTMGGSD